MKTFKLTTLLVSVVWLMSSCVLSVHPFFDDQSTRTPDNLIGMWEERKVRDSIETLSRNQIVQLSASGKDSITEPDKNKWYWVITQGDGDAFKAVHTNNIELNVFIIHVFQLGDELLIDLYPDNMNSTNDLYSDLFLRTHTLARLNIGKDYLIVEPYVPELRCEDLGFDCLRWPSENPNNDGFDLISSETAQLKKIISEHAKDDQYWSNEPLFLKRAMK